MNHRLRSHLVSFALLLVASPSLAADNWPQWRGPKSNGVAADGEYPVKFDAENVTWKLTLPGLGMSTPAVWDDRIFVTCAIDGKDGVIAYDFKGEPVWKKALTNERAGKHKNASGSNPSPATDGKHLVVYYKSGTLAGLDLEGNVLWQKNVFDLYGKDTLWWDVGTSPVIAGGRVVVAVMQGPERGGGKPAPDGSYLAAFDIATGEPAWKTPRQYDRPMESDNSYTTPMLLDVEGRQQLVTFGADHLTGHDAATGELLWDLPGFNPQNEANWRVIASPAVSGSTLLIPYGRAKFLAAVRLGSKPEKIWERTENNIGADVPTPVAVGDVCYVLTDAGRVKCLNLATGDEAWAGDLPKNRNKYYASPVYAGGKLYCTREDGVVYVVDVTKGFKQLSENNMGERIIATPVPLRGGLLVRGVEHLFWIGGQSPKDSQTAG